MPRGARRPALLAPAVDIRHGVCAALDVAAAQERPAVVADLLHPSKNQVGLSIEREKTKDPSSKSPEKLHFISQQHYVSFQI